MKNFVQRGENIAVPAPATVTSGAGVLIGALFGVANGDADTGADLVLSTVGVFNLPKVTADAFTVGETVYWDDTAKRATETATDNTKIGVAVAAAGTGAATVKVRLNGAF